MSLILTLHLGQASLDPGPVPAFVRQIAFQDITEVGDQMEDLMEEMQELKQQLLAS